jgi:lipopolysaccharide heptosyltransferase I
VKPEYQRILVVRLSALGDIVHALPVLSALQREWPDVEVDWLVEEAYAPILSLATGINRLIIVRAKHRIDEPGALAFPGALGFLGARRYLRRRKYDAAIDLQGLIKSAMWARASGARRVIGFHKSNLREPGAARFYTETVHRQVTPHIIQKNLSVLDTLGAMPGRPTMPLKPRPSAAMDAAVARAGGARRFIVINPGAAWPNKRWPAERFGQLAAALKTSTGLSTLITWGPQEQDLAESVAVASAGAAQPAPPTEVADLAALMRDAALVVSGDTGPLHVAAALGTPLVGLYGPTWPQRNGPWHPDDEVLSRAQGCKCIHKRKCLIGQPCINEIPLEDVVAAAERRLSKVRR